MVDPILNARRLFTGLTVLLCLYGCAPDDETARVSPPVAKQVPKTILAHGQTRSDPYYWIRDDSRTDPEVLSLLAAENEYTRAVMAGTEALQDTLFNEITSRLKVDDSTVPVREGGYYYHREFRAGGEYPVYIRHAVEPGSPAEVILDLNELSKGHEYYSVGNWSISPAQNIVAYAEDTRSRREYTIRFKDLETGITLPDEIRNVERDIAWAADNKTVFYVAKDPQTLLPYKVYRHVLGTEMSEDVLVYEESDTAFYTSVYTSRSDRYVIISLQSTDASEIRLIDATRPSGPPAVFLPREPFHEYRIRHVAGTFYIISNWQAENFRLLQVDEGQIGDKAAWIEVIPHRADTLLEDVEVFDQFIAVNELRDGLPRLRVIDRATGSDRTILFNDPTYTAWLQANPEVDATTLRYAYSSLTTPDSIYEYDMTTGQSTLLKQDEVVGLFDPANYTSERIQIVARDGEKVPVSIVYRTDRYQPGKNPVYLEGYGAYGLSFDPEFYSMRLSLLDRGFVYAIAHVRGGQERGRAWYENGRLLNKKNTFYDFIDVTRALVAAGYGDENRIIARGGSAGGLLMGVIANEAPELYLGIIAHVPFVDVMTTMEDESIPLTAGEFSEWGDPRDETFYDYMLTYSPYDQVKQQEYPHMLVTTGLWDSQVQYFEPVKWVSKLRRMKTDDHRLLLHVDMKTGHSGPSGRYDRYRVFALEYAFVLDLVGSG